MKLNIRTDRKARIEMLPLIDIVFLLLVFFIYAMLSMAVHRALPVSLPQSETAVIDRQAALSLTVKSDGTVFLDRQPVSAEALGAVLQGLDGAQKRAGVMVFADRHLLYEQLFKVLDQIQAAGIHRISLQAEAVTVALQKPEGAGVKVQRGAP